MGTVHAKSLETKGAQEEVQKKRVGEKPALQLSSVKAKVDRVHVEGLGRTKDDIVIQAIQEIFSANSFEDVVLKAQQVRTRLEKLGCFRNIGVFIDTSSGPEASSNGLEVTFSVKEFRRIIGGVNTMVGNSEGSLVVGTHLPNLLGRGEKLQAEYSHGSKSSKGFNGTFVKPLHNRANTVFVASVFQQNAEWIPSGFKQIDRGFLFDINFDSVPQVRHNLQWEGVWRELSCYNRSTSFAVREQAGHSAKSALRHILTVDTRDIPVFPSKGHYLRLLQELAGLGGDVGFFKHELHCQTNVPLFADMVLQGTFQGGLMKPLNDEKLIYICDRFFLGGPNSIRGFEVRGVGPHSDDNAVGALAYWAAGLHLFAPLPFRPGRGGLGELFRTHFFVNGGNIENFTFGPAMKENFENLLHRARVSYGVGLMLRFGSVARLELNYCWPLRAERGDRAAPGVQLGFGVQFL